MALYRYVRSEIWTNPKVSEKMDSNEKLIFVYLLTNQHTTQIGIYKITAKQIAYDLDLPNDVVCKVLKKFEDELKIIVYSQDTYEIAIKNWGKYNLNNAGKPLMDCIKKELEEVRDIKLLNVISEHIKKPAIKEIFNKHYNTRLGLSFDVASTSGGQKEKEKEKENENKKEKEKHCEDAMVNKSNLRPIKFLDKEPNYSKPSEEDLAYAKALSQIN